MQCATFTFDDKIFFMQFPSPVSAQWIAGFINAEISGNADSSATGINEIHKVNKGDIVFVDHPKYYDACLNSAATFIIINKKTGRPLIKLYLLWLILLKHMQKLSGIFALLTPQIN